MKDLKISNEFRNSENSLKIVLSVPRVEMQRHAKEYQEQRTKKKHPKTSGISRASNEKD